MLKCKKYICKRNYPFWSGPTRILMYIYTRSWFSSNHRTPSVQPLHLPTCAKVPASREAISKEDLHGKKTHGQNTWTFTAFTVVPEYEYNKICQNHLHRICHILKKHRSFHDLWHQGIGHSSTMEICVSQDRSPRNVDQTAMLTQSCGQFMWQCVKTHGIPFCSHQNSWDLWMWITP